MYIYTYTYIHTHIHIYISLSLSLSIYLSIYLSLYIYREREIETEVEREREIYNHIICRLAYTAACIGPLASGDGWVPRWDSRGGSCTKFPRCSLAVPSLFPRCSLAFPSLFPRCSLAPLLYGFNYTSLKQMFACSA